MLKKKKNKKNTSEEVDFSTDVEGLEPVALAPKKRGEPEVPLEHSASSRIKTKLGYGSKKNTKLDRQRLAVQDLIPVKDTWKSCMVDEYGQFYPMLSIGTKNTDLMSLPDLLKFQKQMESAFSGLRVDSYQILIIPMPFDIGAWVENNNKIREATKKEHYRINELKPLLNEHPDDFEDRKQKMQKHVAWKLEEIDAHEKFVKDKINSGQITTKRSFMVLNLHRDVKKNIRESEAIAKTIANKFSGTELEVRMVSEQEVRDILYVILNPLTPESTNAPSSYVEPNLDDEKTMVDIVLEGEFERDRYTSEFTPETKSEATKTVRERHASRVAYDGESQFKHPEIYPDAKERGALTPEEVEAKNEEDRKEQERLDEIEARRQARKRDRQNPSEVYTQIQEEVPIAPIEEVVVEERVLVPQPVVVEPEPYVAPVEVVEEQTPEVVETPKLDKKELEAQLQEALANMDYGKAQEISLQINKLNEEGGN